MTLEYMNRKRKIGYWKWYLLTYEKVAGHLKGKYYKMTIRPNTFIRREVLGTWISAVELWPIKQAYYKKELKMNLSEKNWFVIAIVIIIVVWL